MKRNSVGKPLDSKSLSGMGHPLGYASLCEERDTRRLVVIRRLVAGATKET